jgi:hypothetical protein
MCKSTAPESREAFGVLRLAGALTQLKDFIQKHEHQLIAL